MDQVHNFRVVCNGLEPVRHCRPDACGSNCREAPARCSEAVARQAGQPSVGPDGLLPNIHTCWLPLAFAGQPQQAALLGPVVQPAPQASGCVHPTNGSRLLPTRPCSKGSTHPQQQGLVLRQPTECRRPGAHRNLAAIRLGSLLAAGRLSESAAALGTAAAGCEQADCCNPVEPACAASSSVPFSRQCTAGAVRWRFFEPKAAVTLPRCEAA